MFLTKLR